MVTYNHEKFIAQAIESVLMQEADFPVELVIGEDCSTDATRSVVQQYAARYPNAIRALLPDHNLGACENGRAVTEECHGEYIAFLEGDDYWTDRRKLQIQVELLDKEPSFILCAHRFRIFDEAANVFHDDGREGVFQRRSRMVTTYQNFLDPYVISTLTLLFRREGLRGVSSKHTARDIVFWSHLLSQGRDGVVLNRVMAVYRQHAGGMWSGLHGQASAEFLFEGAAAIVSLQGFASGSVRDAYSRRAHQVSSGWISKIGKSLVGLAEHTDRVIKGLPAEYRPGTLDRAFHRSVCTLSVALTKLFWLQANSLRWMGGGRGPSLRWLRLRCRQLAWLVALTPVLLLHGVERLLRLLRRREENVCAKAHK